MATEALNNREVKKITEMIKEQFGLQESPIKDLIFLKRGDGRIYLAADDIRKLTPLPPYPNSLGMYFGFEEKNGFRLSLEGAQIIGPHAKKQVLELNEEQLKEWFNGQNLKTESIDKGFTLLKRKNDYVGCG